MEGQMLYTAPEMTVCEADVEDIVLISVNDEDIGEIPQLPFLPNPQSTPPLY